MYLPRIRPDVLVCSYRDRLSRFGQSVLEAYCRSFSVRLVALQERESQSSDKRLVEDMIALLTSFAGRLHRSRRGSKSTKSTKSRKTGEAQAMVRC